MTSIRRGPKSRMEADSTSGFSTDNAFSTGPSNPLRNMTTVIQI